MKRDVLQQMFRWKEDPERKPLILKGARQVGKTWIMKEFAAKNGITGKDYYHLGLLTEEVLGMANQILHVYDGELWVEGTAAGYEIILEAAIHERNGEKAVPRFY